MDPAPSRRSVDMDEVSNKITLVLNIITIVLGISGNSVVIYVSALKIKTKVTNVFLVNLAVADLLFCITRIFSFISKLRDDWPFGYFLCKFNGFFKYLNMFCSVFLLAVISLDRALCVWRPLLIKTKRTVFAARVLAALVWTLTIVLSVPYYMYRGVKTEKNMTKCTIDFAQEEKLISRLYWLRFVCGFVLPFMFILVCYILTGLGIKRTNLPKKTRSLKVLVILVAAFFLCWAPYHCLLLCKMVSEGTRMKLSPWVRIMSAIAYFNSCVNPLLYYCLGVGLGGSFRCRLPSVCSRAMADDMEEENNQEDL